MKEVFSSESGVSIPVWNYSEMPPQPRPSVIDLFRKQVRSRPDAIAVKDEFQYLSYDQLDRLSNRVAHRLIKEGLGKEELVAVLLGRSVLFVVAVLAILKAGGSYLPLDRLNSDQRIALLLADSGVRFVIGKQKQCDRVAGLVESVIRIDESLSDFQEEDDSESVQVSDPSRRAYMIYTSGSTGMPKGVEIEHHSLSNLVAWYQHCLSLSENDSVAMIANIAFDGSVGDLWPALCLGARIMIPYGSLISDIGGLMTWLTQENISVTFIPTAILELMLTHRWPADSSLRFLITGGDTLRVRPPATLPFALINGYGPTESTVFSTWSMVSPSGSEYPPIGRPSGNVKAYVLDAQQKPVPMGEKGELYLGGEQIARGYRNRPELTQKAFLPDPFADHSNALMYRTGDWVYQGEDGELRFIGRMDDQVQIYGHRFELGEVEHALRSHPSVREVCCRPIHEEGAVSGIAAHVVAWHFSSTLRDELTEIAMQALPIAAVPKTIQFHERFPVTQQGKINRQALDYTALDQKQIVSELSEEEIENKLIALWKMMLPDVLEINTEANFFELGGDSLLAGKFILKIEEVFHLRMTLMTFMQNPTLGGLFEYLKKGGDERSTPLIPFQPTGTRPPIFFLYNLSGDLGCYWNLAYALGKDQPSYGLASPAAHNLEKIPSTIEEAASQIITQLLKLNLKTPPALVGYSWAGWLAFEVGRQWIELGHESPFIALLGTESPLLKVNLASRIIHFIRWAPNRFFRLFDGNKFGANFMKILKRLKEEGIVRYALEVPEGILSPIMKRHIELVLIYSPTVCLPMELDLFRETQELKKEAPPLEPAFTRHKPDDGWGRLVGLPPRIHWVDSDHDNLLRPPAVNQLAVELRSAMDTFYTL